jgi:hypothetical protein
LIKEEKTSGEEGEPPAMTDQDSKNLPFATPDESPLESPREQEDDADAWVTVNKSGKGLTLNSSMSFGQSA